MLGIAFFLVSFTVARAQDITYDLVDYPADENGYSLSGFITTDGSMGSLSSSDLVSWSYEIYSGTSSLGSGSSPSGDWAFYGVVATLYCNFSSPLCIGENPGSEVNFFTYSSAVVWVNDSGGGPNQTSHTITGLGLLETVCGIRITHKWAAQSRGSLLKQYPNLPPSPFSVSVPSG